MLDLIKNELLEQIRKYKLLIKYKFNKISTILELKKLSLDTSKQLFIFGTGFSINHLDDNFLEIVRSNVSISVNNFLLHELNTNIIYLELDDKRLMLDELYVQLIKNKQYDCIILNNEGLSIDRLNSFLDDVGKAYISISKKYIGIQQHNLARHYSLSDRLLSHDIITHNSGSVELLIQMAIWLGFEDICIVGCDGYNPKHFYEDASYNTLAARAIRALYTKPRDIGAECDVSISEDHKRGLGLSTLTQYAERLSNQLSRTNKHRNVRVTTYTPGLEENSMSAYFDSYDFEESKNIQA